MKVFPENVWNNIVFSQTWSFSFCRAISFSCTSLLSRLVLSITQSKMPWGQINTGYLKYPLQHHACEWQVDVTLHFVNLQIVCFFCFDGAFFACVYVFRIIGCSKLQRQQRIFSAWHQRYQMQFQVRGNLSGNAKVLFFQLNSLCRLVTPPPHIQSFVMQETGRLFLSQNHLICQRYPSLFIVELG